MRHFFSSQTSRICPSCSKSLPTPLPACTSCWHISNLPVSPNTLQLYDILDVPTSPNPFVVDLAKLKAKFRKAQTICHPDTWAVKGQDKQAIAQSLSSRVNSAYQTLQRPLSRAEYLLEIMGLPLTEEDKTGDSSFLTQIYLARESLDEAETVDELQQVAEENTDHIDQAIRDIEESVGNADWENVKASAIKLKYLEGIRQAITEHMERISSEAHN